MGVYSVLSRNLENIKQLSPADPGKIPPPPLPILRPNWGLEGPKHFFVTGPPVLSQGLDNRPHPPLTLIHVKCVFLNNTRCCLHDLQLQLKYLSFSDLQSTFSKEYTFGTCAMCPSHSDVGLIKSSLKGVKKGRNHSRSVVSDGSRGGA